MTVRAAEASPAEFKRDLARRLGSMGPIDIPRSSGKRRTESKRTLLEARAEMT